VGEAVGVGVTLGVTLGVGVGVGVGVSSCTSKEPMSIRPFTTQGRADHRKAAE